MRSGILKVLFFSLITLFVFWLPFLFKAETFWGISFQKSGMDVIVRNFDGVNFLVVERSWYKPEFINEINSKFLTGNDPIYFSAHYPLYAGLIWLFDQFTTGPNAILISILFSNIFLSIGLFVFFNEVVKDSKLSFLLSLLMLIFPARMFSVRSVGSTEPIFIFFILMSIVMYLRKKNLISAIYGSLAVLTRSPGILLFLGYVLGFLFKSKNLKLLIKNTAPYLLMPVTLLGLFVFYGFQYGDYLAYFNSGDNIHLFFPPFQVFSNMQSWSGGMWMEDVIYLYLYYGIGLYGLYKLSKSKKRNSILFPIALVYVLIIPFIAHRDIARYSLPMAPIVLIGYLDHIDKKVLSGLIMLLIIPALIWGWAFVLENVQPVNDWSVLL